MIDIALAQITGQLDQALQRQFQVREDDKLVVLCHLHEQDGTAAKEAVGKVAAFLVNVEREVVPGSGSGAGRPLARALVQPEPVHLNLMVMFAANYAGGNYTEALKMLSSTVAFFQARPVFNQQNTPDLDPRIDKLTMEIENLSISDLSNLWGVLSGKYLPSVLYRMRLLAIDAGQLSAQAPRIVQPEARVSA